MVILHFEESFAQHGRDIGEKKIQTRAKFSLKCMFLSGIHTRENSTPLERVVAYTSPKSDTCGHRPSGAKAPRGFRPFARPVQKPPPRRSKRSFLRAPGNFAAGVVYGKVGNALSHMRTISISRIVGGEVSADALSSARTEPLSYDNSDIPLRLCLQWECGSGEGGSAHRERHELPPLSKPPCKSRYSQWQQVTATVGGNK